MTTKQGRQSSTESGQLSAPGTGTQGALEIRSDFFMLLIDISHASSKCLPAGSVSAACGLPLRRPSHSHRRSPQRLTPASFISYREGLEAGKAETIQAGFNEGFAKASVAAFLDGQVGAPLTTLPNFFRACGRFPPSEPSLAVFRSGCRLNGAPRELAWPRRSHAASWQP